MGRNLTAVIEADDSMGRGKEEDGRIKREKSLNNQMREDGKEEGPPFIVEKMTRATRGNNLGRENENEWPIISLTASPLAALRVFPL